MKPHQTRRHSESESKKRKATPKRTSPGESVAPSTSEVTESAASTQASLETGTEGEDDLSRANASNGSAFQFENHASAEEEHCDEGKRQNTVSSALSSDTTGLTAFAVQATPKIFGKQREARDGAEDTSTKRPGGTWTRLRGHSVHPDTRDGVAVNATPVSAGLHKSFSDSDIAALSTTISMAPGDASTSSGDENSASQFRNFSLRTKKKIRVPFFRIREKYHQRPSKPEVPMQTGSALPVHNRAIDKKESTNDADCRESRKSGTRARPPVIHPGKRLEEAISTPVPASAFTPVVDLSDDAKANSAKGRTSPQRPLSPVSEAACRDRATTPSPPPTTTSPSSPVRSPKNSWTSILSSGRTTPRTGALLALLKRVSRDSSSSAAGRDARSPKCLERLSTVSEIHWACDDDEPQLEASAAARPGASPTTLAAGSSSEKAGRRNVYFSDERDDTELLRIPEVPLSATPYNIRSSKLPRFMNLKDTHAGHRYRKSLIAMLVLSPVLIFVLLIAALVLKHDASLRRVQIFQIADELKKSCWSGNKPAVSGCLVAVDQMVHAMDWFANPCLELDRFVCGRWRSSKPNRSTYRQESADNLTVVIHESLLFLLGNLHLYGHEEGSMAVFYNSCRSFLSSRSDRTASASDVISALGLRRRLDAINETTGTQGLLDFVVGTSLGTGLSSVVSVSSRAGRIYVDVGQSLQSTLSGARVGLYANVTLGELDIGKQSVTPFLDLDKAVQSCVEDADRTQPFLDSALGVLGEGSFGASFVDALNQAAPPETPAHSADSLVAVRCLSEIRATLATLAAASLRRAYVYSAMVLLAQVMKYAYILHSGAAAAQDATKTCVEITGQHFKAFFPHWVAKKVLGEAVLAAFHAMAKTLRQGVVLSAKARELEIADTDLAELKVVVVGEHSVTAWPRSSPISAVPTRYDDRFLLNVVRASRDGIDSYYDERAVERQLGGRVDVGDFEDHSAIFVPADFLVADMMYYSSGPEINFPTVGVWLLVQWIRAAVFNKAVQEAAGSSGEDDPGGKVALRRKSRDASAGVQTGSARRGSMLREKNVRDTAWSIKNISEETPILARGSRDTAGGRKAESGTSGRSKRVGEEHQSDLVEVVDAKVECLRQEASRILSRNVSVVEAEALFFVNWALDAAMLATAAESRAAGSSWWWADEHRTTKMFFMRFCHSTCGEEPMADACRLQAMRHPELALAFHCPEPHVARC
ncbi:uncharacterized protein [Dermacentor albipictus]|uniref:uncharacterized protein n=1 Tax=Dermacentor albipictus TaxID=60249 RepID=UPI0038FBEF3B